MHGKNTTRQYPEHDNCTNCNDGMIEFDQGISFQIEVKRKSQQFRSQ